MSQKEALTIKNWNKTFECSHSRKREALVWFQCPTGTESTGLIYLRKKENGLKALGIFLLLLQLHSTNTNKEIRITGQLRRSNGEPLSTEILADKLRISERDLNEAIDILTFSNIGWLSFEPVLSGSNSDDGGYTEEQNQEQQVDQEILEAASLVALYPKQVKSNEALKAVKHSLEHGADIKQIEQGTRAIVKVINETRRNAATNKYVPHVGTFFIEERWRDDPESYRNEEDKNLPKRVNTNLGTANENVKLDLSNHVL
tara:strand:- start:4903 stop:5679 length:777 start_codon:yes stop_codon:yes gene_type:complete